MAYRPRKNGDRAEQIHLPGPSLLPLFTAIGLTIALLGLILSWGFVIAGGADRAAHDVALDQGRARRVRAAAARALAPGADSATPDCASFGARRD